jgi:heptosyltransferase-3
MPAPERLACLIAGRNLGDIVMACRFLQLLNASGYARQYVVWTRPQLAFLFAGLADCQVIGSEFPVGTSKNFGWRQALRFLRAAWDLRRMRPSVTIDLIGDVRERAFARLAGSRRHIFPGWASGHPFRRIIRNPFGVSGAAVQVPAMQANVYQAHDALLRHLLSQGSPAPAPPTAIAQQAAATVRRWTVGLHPFASQACKLWPLERWRELTQRLLERGASVRLFGSPAERTMLQTIVPQVAGDLTLVTGSIPEFAQQVSRLDLLVGLDSFAVHMAQQKGVRSVAIFGGNPPAMWTPPDGLGLGASGGCRSYPCFNVPNCQGTEQEYACVRSISVEQVLAAIDRQADQIRTPTETHF